MPRSIEEILMSGAPPNQQMQAVYAKKYPFLAQAIASPQGLMQLIDGVHKREAANQPGTEADLFTAKAAQQALADVYGINSYTPKGTMQWNAEMGNWVNPRAPANSIVNDKR